MRRHRKRSAREERQVADVRKAAADFFALLHEIGGTDIECDRMASRDLALALTHMEDAAMRAVRHITS